MKRIRLEHLAHLLETDPKDGMESFRMQTWMHKKKSRDGQCQLAGCAIGRASLDKRFHRWGLRMKFRNGETHGSPMYRGSEEFYAAAELFDIFVDDARYLFNPNEYNVSRVTPQRVAKRIRQFVANGGVFDEYDGDRY